MGSSPESRPGVVTLDYQYEPLTGRPTAVVGPTLGLETQQRTREYDVAGRISALRGSMFLGGAAEQSLLFGYAGGLRTSETFAGAVVGVVATTYDNHFRVATETVNGGLGVTFGYDRDSLLTSAGELTIGRDLPSGRILTISNTHAGHTVVEHRTYDTFGAVASMDYRRDGTSFFRLAFTRDDLGRIATKTETVDGATHVFAYEYDEAGRLTDVTRDGTDVEHYEYDPNGNRLIGESYGILAAGTYDAQDRLVSYGPHTYSYAPNGELERRSGPRPLTTEYDVFGNLRTVAAAGETRTYVADAKGRRVQRLVDGDFDAAWLWRSQLQPVAALDEAGAVEQRYQYADGVNVPDLAVDVATGARWRLVKDQVGSVRIVVDVETGAVVRRVDFDSFGRVLASAGEMDAVPFEFAGGMWEPATGLVRFGARDYDPEIGRWTSKDPIRFDGGVNLYAYAKNDPVNHIDPDGRRLKTIAEGVQAALDWAQGYFGQYWGDDSNDAGSPPSPYRDLPEPPDYNLCMGKVGVFKTICCLELCGVGYDIDIDGDVCPGPESEKESDCYLDCMGYKM